MSKPAKAKPEAKALGRPTIYNQEIADKICVGLAEGLSLRKVCEDTSLPSRATVYLWLQHNDDFLDHYKRARDIQADAMVDDILDIADEECTKVRADKHPRASADDDGMVEVVFDAVAVARNKLRIDARKWLAGKIKPRVYSDKLTPEQGDDEETPVTPVKVVVQVQDARKNGRDQPEA